jgi:hypothetical protein
MRSATSLKGLMSQFLIGAIVVLLAGFVGSGSSAQKGSRPNFSGTWAMENARRSLDPSEKDFIIERQKLEPSEMTLTISDDGTEIRVLRKFSVGQEQKEQTVEYHTDGRGETNPSLTSGKTTFRTRTRWTKDHLLIRFDPSTVSTSGRPLTAHRQIEWRLEEAGTRLVEKDTTHFQEASTVDSSVSASDLRGFSIVPPSITVRRLYKRIS